MIDVKEEQIKLLCKQLKLPTFANYRDILRQSRSGADFSDLLLDLLMAETNARQENQNRRRLKAAGFPFQKTLDEYDFSWLNPSISPVFIHELASCKFIDDRKNIVMIGNPGRGKTHISIAIGLKACLQGYRVLFKNAGTLATELTEARDAYQLGRIERQLEKTDLLILDELSYMSFNKYELLFQLLVLLNQRRQINLDNTVIARSRRRRGNPFFTVIASQCAHWRGNLQDNFGIELGFHIFVRIAVSNKIKEDVQILKAQHSRGCGCLAGIVRHIVSFDADVV